MSIPCFAYLRVSGLGQVDGFGFDRQLTTCQAYAKTHDLEIVSVFREEGVSGTTDIGQRPALQALYAALKQNGIKTVIIERLDRLARNLKISEGIIEDMQENGFILISACEPDLNSLDPDRILVRQMFAAIAQHAASTLKGKLGKAREFIKENGRTEKQKNYSTDPVRNRHSEGSYPYGHDPKRPEEIPVLNQIIWDHAHGKRPDAIAEYLNTAGVLTRGVMRNGALIRGPWRASLIRKIVARESGTIHKRKPQDVNPGDCKSCSDSSDNQPTCDFNCIRRKQEAKP